MGPLGRLPSLFYSAVIFVFLLLLLLVLHLFFAFSFSAHCIAWFNFLLIYSSPGMSPVWTNTQSSIVCDGLALPFFESTFKV